MVFGSCLVSAGAPGQARNDEQAKAIAAFGKFRVGLHFDELQAGRPVVEADLREMDITDADLALLKPFVSLRKLSLSMTDVSDAGIMHLKALINLEELNLGPDV